MNESNPYASPMGDSTSTATRPPDTSIIHYGFLGMACVGILGAVWIGIRSNNVVLAPLLVSMFVLVVGGVWFGLSAWLCKSTSNELKLFVAGLAGALTGLTVALTGVLMDFPNGIPRFALVAMIVTCAVITGSTTLASFFSALIRYQQLRRTSLNQSNGTRA